FDQVKTRLEQEVEKVVNAGHLRPGYFNSGQIIYDGSYNCGYANPYSIGDYWSNPADTIYTLLRARPHLTPALRTRLDTYLKAEFNAYPPYEITHIGWKDGAAREVFTLPPEVQAGRAAYIPLKQVTGFPGWTYNPFGFYAMWKYAEAYGGAKEIFDASEGRL